MLRKPDYFLSARVTLFLFSIYLVFFTGRYYTIDEMAMTSAAESLVNTGRFTIDQLRWVNMSGGLVGVQGVDGSLYSRNPVTQTLLLAGMKLAARPLPQIGQLQAAALLNPILTALTGGLLVLFGQRLGYSRRASSLTALAFGLSTIALPYSKFLFAEPLIGLALLASAYALYRFRQDRKAWFLLGAGVGLGVAAGSRPVNVVFVIVWLVYLASLVLPGPNRPDRSEQLAQFLKMAGLFLMPVVISIALLGYYNWIRFGNPLDSGYVEYENFRHSLWNGLAVVLLSPGKSLFLYSPLLILAVSVGWIRFMRDHRLEAMALMSGATGLLLVTAKWWDPEGGWAWGPRLHVGLTGLLTVFLYPLFDVSRRHRAALGFAMLFGLGVQMLGATVDFARVIGDLPAHLQPPGSEAMVFDPAYSPFDLHAGYLLAGRLDLAWVSNSEGGARVALDRAALGFLLMSVLFSATSLGLLEIKQIGMPLVRGSFALATFAVVGLALALLMHYYQTNLLHVGDVEDATADIQQTKDADRPGLIISSAIAHQLSLQNVNRSGIPFVGVLGQAPVSDDSVSFYRGILRTPRQIWLLQEWILPYDGQNQLNQWLGQRAFQASAATFGALSLTQYFTGESPTIDAPEYRFGRTADLKEVGLSVRSLRAGEVLLVSVVWQAHRPSSSDSKVFLHLLDADGQLAAQIDRPPGNGFRPVSTWRVGEHIEDRFALRIPPAIPPGTYRLAMGWYDAVTLIREKAYDSEEHEIGDSVHLADVVVAP